MQNEYVTISDLLEKYLLLAKKDLIVLVYHLDCEVVGLFPGHVALVVKKEEVLRWALMEEAGS